MKKIIVLFILLVFGGLVSGCQNNNDKVIKVIATAVPHEEILLASKPLLKAQGYDLKIIVTDDYGVPNQAVANGSADANFFQHIPFFNQYNQKNPNNQLVNVAAIHIEPIGLYSKRYDDINDLVDGDTIIISNSEPDHGRFLFFLSNLGVIKLKSGFSVETGSLADITENNKNIKFKQVQPELLTSAYREDEGAFVFINGNYALGAKLNPKVDAKYLESTIDNPFVNILAVKKGNENLEKIKVLASILTSKEIKDFINRTYQGSVISTS